MEDLTKSRVFWSGCGWGVFEKNYCLYGAMCVCIKVERRARREARPCLSTMIHTY